MLKVMRDKKNFPLTSGSIGIDNSNIYTSLGFISKKDWVFRNTNLIGVNFKKSLEDIYLARI